jgi:hypothetical protein
MKITIHPEAEQDLRQAIAAIKWPTWFFDEGISIFGYLPR